MTFLEIVGIIVLIYLGIGVIFGIVMCIRQALNSPGNPDNNFTYYVLAPAAVLLWPVIVKDIIELTWR